MGKAIEFFIERFRELLTLEAAPATYYKPRPYRNAAVNFLNFACTIEDFEVRLKVAENAGLNGFMFPSNMLPGCDLLSDSGTTTMTMKQWAKLLQGDEAYGSNEGFFELKEQIADTFGPEWKQETPEHEILFLFHQGRAAEHALFTSLASELAGRADSLEPLEDAGWLNQLVPNLEKSIRDGTDSIEGRIRHKGGAAGGVKFIIPSNGHFDTTQENIEDSLAVPLNLPCAQHLNKDKTYPFRGNMNVEELKSLLEHAKDRVPLVYLTITNNAGGGQPVSMENIAAVGRISREHGVPFLVDACRFAENAWFIKQKEAGFRDKAIKDIVWEMFGHADGFHISFKKDGLVNIGGALVLRPGGLLETKYRGLRDRLIDWQIMVEGHPSYGGMAGRDLKGTAEGLRTVVREQYLHHRIHQVEKFGKKLEEYGIPIVTPIGGHALYIDVDDFFKGTDTKDGEFKGVALTALLLIAGHRLCELGVYAFGRYDSATGEEIPPVPRVNYVRAAVPRLAYEDQDLLSVAEVLRVLREHRDRIPGVKVTHGQDLTLRHFKSRFKFMD